jgi:hypothetical protein
MKKLVIACLISSLFLWSCQPKPNASDLLKKLVVYTDYDKTAKFSTDYNSFYLRIDSINYYNPGYDTLVLSQQSGDFVDYVTHTIKDTLVARGYQSVSRKSSPDLKVSIYIVENYSVSYSYYPYSYGYGYGYGGGYSANVSDQADFYIQILDLKHPTNGKPTVIWSCDIGDIVTLASDEVFINALAQAFKQSSYLRK